MTPANFQDLMLVIQTAQAAGIGALVIMAFRHGKWQGNVNASIKANLRDHARYDRHLERRVGDGD